MFVNYMYQKTPFFDSSLIKTLLNFMTLKYNPSLISCNKVCYCEIQQQGIGRIVHLRNIRSILVCPKSLFLHKLPPHFLSAKYTKPCLPTLLLHSHKCVVYIRERVPLKLAIVLECAVINQLILINIIPG